MKEPTWEKCPYYPSGRCPQHSTIDRAYLIPQLLEASELEAAIDACDQCEIYDKERRKYRRIARPFRVVVSNKQAKQNIEGTVVNVSVKGALIRLDNWIPFDKEQMVDLKLYNNKLISDKEEINVVNVSGQIKRVAEQKQELAIVFV